ncbi:hypothetical protein [Lentzea sp. NPDC060358]|uniref:hypothetical protein n=1 Tax=Lentzea sp. NPDC060358 TaxID=3347103 RepID=UPI0036549CC5
MSRPDGTEQDERHVFLRAEDVRVMVVEAKDSPAGLRIYRTWIDGLLDLDFLTMTGPLVLVGCHFTGELTMRHAQIATIDLSGSAVWDVRAEGLRTRQFEMTHARCADLFDLDHAQVDGSLSLNGSSVGSFTAYGLRVGGSFTARGLYAHPRFRGGTALFLLNCEVGGDLLLDDAVVTGLGGSAVVADGTRIRGMVSAAGAVLRGDGASDAVSLIDCIAGALELTGAVLRAQEGSALNADGAQFRAEATLKWIDAVSRGPAATVQMIDTRIGAGLLLTGLVRNRGGRAVLLHKTAVEASLSVREAEIDAVTGNSALEISNCDVASALVLLSHRIVNRGDGLQLDLVMTGAGRALVLDTGGLTDVTLNGLTYPEPTGDTDAWLRVLRDHTHDYEAQPYQQLAAVHRAAGHEHTARRVLIAQQEDLRRRGDPGNRLWHWFLGVTLGYGHRPSRAVAGLLVTFLLAVGLVWTAGAAGGLTPAKDRPAESCSPVNRISLAADLAIPLVKLGGTPRCELANGPAGQWATGAGWAVQILGWSFATLSVAGFTGLVRKS